MKLYSCAAIIQKVVDVTVTSRVIVGYQFAENKNEAIGAFIQEVIDDMPDDFSFKNMTSIEVPADKIKDKLGLS